MIDSKYKEKVSIEMGDFMGFEGVRLERPLLNCQHAKVTNYFEVQFALGFSLGRAMSNTINELVQEFGEYHAKMGDKFGRLFQDIKTFEENYNILESQEKLKYKIIEDKIEGERITPKELNDINKFEDTRRDLQMKYVKKWVMYNKLFGA